MYLYVSNYKTNYMTEIWLKHVKAVNNKDSTNPDPIWAMFKNFRRH
jgi:hypothetical protein